LAIASAIGAPLTGGDRTTITYLYPVGGDLTGTYVNYYNSRELRGAPGDTAIEPWTVKLGAYNHYAFGTPEMDAVLDLTLLPGTMTVNATLISGVNGYYDWGYDVGVGPTFAESFITAGIDMGRYALFFEGGGSGGTGIGDTFVSTVRIQGDWSDAANRSALSFNPAWTITENFLYDGVGTTIISGFITNYNGENPSFAFTLYGDPVAIPEPASIALAAAGLALLAARAGRFGR